MTMADSPRQRHAVEPGVSLTAPPPFAPDHPDLDWLFSLNRHGYRPGLRRIRGLLADLGHPERSFRSLVVAGTNGKGSTTRLLAGLCRAAGYRTATYTSPHLLHVTERLEIDDRPVDRERFLAAAARVRPLTERHGASWFETLTAITALICHEQGIEVLCCETGLGGRLDATRALPASAVLLTGVALDHQRILGETREEIAAEKLGLLAPGVPLLTGVDAKLRPQVFRAAVAAGAPCLFLDEACRIEPGAGTWRLTTRRHVHADLPPLSPPVMRRNAALALLTLEELAAADSWWRLPEDTPAALADVFLPGRFHWLLEAPDVICDTAHNDEALTLTLDAFLTRPCPGRRLVLFGGMADKTPGPGVGDRLRRCDLIHAAPPSLPRARNPRQLEGLLNDTWRLPAARVTIHNSLRQALSAVAAAAGPRDTVLVCGSCFLVAEVLHLLGYTTLEATRERRPAAPVLTSLLGR